MNRSGPRLNARFAWTLAVAAWIGVIFFSSTNLAELWCEQAFRFVASAFWNQPNRDSASYSIVHLVADKGLHVTMFCVLAALLWNALAETSGKWAKILLAGAVVGSCSEFLQRFFPGRDPALRDVLINIGGTALGLALSSILSRRLSHSRILAGKPALKTTSR